MAAGIATVEVRSSRGVLVVQALGRTNRGQKFIKGIVPLGVKSTTDPTFKSHLETAVAELFAE